jgi:hypothetical protein
MRAFVRIALAVCCVVGTANMALASCVVPDNGGGTVDLPPAGCDYLSPDEVHMIIDGLPPGTTIRLAPIHRDFICGQGGAVGCPPPGQCEAPGGSLGGNSDCFNSQLQFDAVGTGDLTGFHRTLSIPVQCQVHTGPRAPGAQVQSFDTEMFMLQGQIGGDPDFDLLRVTAGSGFGLPSPGHTTLTRIGQPGSPYAVDSFFDVFYRIDFIGAPGSQLAGMSGSTTGTIRMSTGTEALPLPAANVWAQIALTLVVLGAGVAVLQRRVFA